MGKWLLSINAKYIGRRINRNLNNVNEIIAIRIDDCINFTNIKIRRISSRSTAQISNVYSIFNKMHLLLVYLLKKSRNIEIVNN